MEDEKPKLRLGMLSEKPVDLFVPNTVDTASTKLTGALVEPVPTAMEVFDGNDYIKELVFNTNTKEDFFTYTKEDMLTANIAVLNKVVARFLKLRPDELAKMIKDELDGKVWFR